MRSVMMLMLRQWIYRDKGPERLGEIPVGLQLRLMHQCPLGDQTQRSRRQRAAEHCLIGNTDLCPVLAVLGVKMGRWMIRPIQPDGYPVEAADSGHCFLLRP